MSVCGRYSSAAPFLRVLAGRSFTLSCMDDKTSLTEKYSVQWWKNTGGRTEVIRRNDENVKMFEDPNGSKCTNTSDINV